MQVHFVQHGGSLSNARHKATTHTGEGNQVPNGKNVRFNSNLSATRTLTKTNGSLNLDMDTEDDYVPASEQSLSTSSDEGEDNMAYMNEPSDKIVAYKVPPSNPRQRMPEGARDPLYHISNDHRLNDVIIPQSYYNTAKNPLPYNQDENFPSRLSVMNNHNQIGIPIKRPSRPGPPTAPKPSIVSQLKNNSKPQPFREITPSITSSDEEIQEESFQPIRESMKAANFHRQPMTSGEQTPFNYIAFSQYLYGEKPVHQQQQGGRNVSFV